MVKMKATYTGEKHCQLFHEPSGSEISTDAPKDNHGRGEAFSPTDLCSISLGSCMLTVMAIAAEKEGLSLLGSEVEVLKGMKADPRRIGTLGVKLRLPQALSIDWRTKLENIALNCPVKLSLHPDIDFQIQFQYDK